MLANVLVLDLELTTAGDDSIGPEQMEVVEVGAVWITAEGQILDCFHSFVRPMERPQLTDFCKRLLPHVDQATIDVAPSWPTVAAALAEFAQLHQQPGSWWCSWGSSDRRQLQQEGSRHRAFDPLAGLAHENLKKNFAKARRIKQCGMVAAMKICNLTQQGQHHHALADALNVARLLPFCPRRAPAAEG
jgi:inhibitor of KinA sporulation pathway (predicted exonuclease)